MKLDAVWRLKGLRVLLLLVAVIAAFGLGYWFEFGRSAKDANLRGSLYVLEPRKAESGGVKTLPTAAATHIDDDEHTVFVCPMVCVPPMKSPGKCPVCGMELIPQAAGEKEEASPRLKLSSDAVKMARIQVASVERKMVSAEVRLFGQIDFDPAHTSVITAFMPGLINRVYIKRAGQFVRWGEPLFDIYSPDLLEAQQQLVKVIKYVPSFLAFQAGRPHVARDVPVLTRKSAEDPGKRSAEVEEAYQLIEAIRRKLMLLGLPRRDIDEFMKTGEATGTARVYAPMYGQVTEQNAYEGAYVNIGTPIFKIADPQFVWVKLQAYEVDYPWIRKDQKVSFQADAYPGETFEGKVIYIDPVFDIKTRTFTVAAVSPDLGGRLKSGMIVRAAVEARLSAEGKVVDNDKADAQAPLVIPASAPLITGKRAVVYVAVPGQENVFEGREIALGPKAKDHYIVTAGLTEGEQVVVNGNFKIDSAVQILAKPSLMSIGEKHSVVEHHHHGGSDLMHEEYWSERMKSRSESMAGQEQAVRDVPGNVHSDHVRDTPSPAQSTILRRKPGAYGETTRGAQQHR